MFVLRLIFPAPVLYIRQSLQIGFRRMTHVYLTPYAICQVVRHTTPSMERLAAKKAATAAATTATIPAATHAYGEGNGASGAGASAVSVPPIASSVDERASPAKVGSKRRAGPTADEQLDMETDAGKRADDEMEEEEEYMEEEDDKEDEGAAYVDASPVGIVISACSAAPQRAAAAVDAQVCSSPTNSAGAKSPPPSGPAIRSCHLKIRSHAYFHSVHTHVCSCTHANLQGPC